MCSCLGHCPKHCRRNDFFSKGVIRQSDGECGGSLPQLSGTNWSGFCALWGIPIRERELSGYPSIHPRRRNDLRPRGNPAAAGHFALCCVR